MRMIIEAPRMPGGGLADGAIMADSDTGKLYFLQRQSGGWVEFASILEDNEPDQLQRKQVEGPSIRKPVNPPANCPNCGAPVRGHSCEYCGTVFDWATYLEVERTRARNRPERGSSDSYLRGRTLSGRFV